MMKLHICLTDFYLLSLVKILETKELCKNEKSVHQIDEKENVHLHGLQLQANRLHCVLCCSLDL